MLQSKQKGDGWIGDSFAYVKNKIQDADKYLKEKRFVGKTMDFLN